MNLRASLLTMALPALSCGACALCGAALSAGRPTGEVAALHGLAIVALVATWVVARRTDAARTAAQASVHAAELQKARDDAAAAIRVKSEFLANMSHELRTPLTGLMGVCELLAEGRNLDAGQRRLLGLATDSGRVLLAVVDDILDFSLMEAGRLKLERVPVNLRSLVDSTIALVDERARRKRLSVAVTFASDVPEIAFDDPIRLRQLLLNLLGNAIKFTETGGVTIRVGIEPGVPALRVEVVDTGIGIPADALPRLFQRFSQADASVARKFGGSGLGLAICRQILTVMGGSIGAVSTPGHGSTFWFTLPLLRAPDDTNATDAATKTAGRGLRLLLAEDNLIIREIIVAATRNKGHEVVAVPDGRAAYEVFTAQSFDAVLMDIQMPGTDGLAATALIRGFEARQARRPTPIVALTANALSADMQLCLQAGMNAHVAKPIVWAELFATLERLTTPPSATVPTVSAQLGAAGLNIDLFGRAAQVELGSLLRKFETGAPARDAIDGASGLRAGRVGPTPDENGAAA